MFTRQDLFAVALASLLFAGATEGTLRPTRAAAQAPADVTPPSQPTVRAVTTGSGVRDERDSMGPHYTLEDALRAMRAQHPQLVAAERAVDAARADRRATSLWTNPVVEAQYYMSIHNNSYDPIGYPTYGLTQFIEFANAPAARGRAANLTVWATRGDYGSMVIELSMDVQAAMIDLVQAQRKVALVGQALELLDHAAHIVDQRVAAGATPRYDSTRIAVTTAIAHSDYESLRADFARAQGELNAAIGPGVSTLRGQPYYLLDQAPELPSAAELVDILVKRRPDLEAARQRAEAAKVAISSTRRAVWPGMSISAIGGFGNAPGQVDVGVGVSVPLPVVDYGQGIIPGAQARALQAQANYDAVLIPARLRIYGMHQEVVTRRRAYEEYIGRAVASGDEMLKEAQAGYLSGRFSVLELVDAYVAWRDSRLRAVDLAAAARNAEVELSRTIGARLPGR
ncbi:MAG: transporter [Myxococcaceae bacterium]|nr:transporter [Myxococcaceae bacterium]